MNTETEHLERAAEAWERQLELQAREAQLQKELDATNEAFARVRKLVKEARQRVTDTAKQGGNPADLHDTGRELTTQQTLLAEHERVSAELEAQLTEVRAQLDWNRQVDQLTFATEDAQQAEKHHRFAWEKAHEEFRAAIERILTAEERLRIARSNWRQHGGPDPSNKHKWTDRQRELVRAVEAQGGNMTAIGKLPEHLPLPSVDYLSAVVAEAHRLVKRNR